MFSPTKSSIKEANEHLQALYKRVAELEDTVKEQASALMQRDEKSQISIRDVVRQKDLEIGELHKSLAASEARVQKLWSQNKEKDTQIEQMRSKIQLLEDACDNLPSLESCVLTLKQAHDLILSTGGMRSRHASGRARSASGPLSSTSAGSGGLHNDVNMEVYAGGNSGSSSTGTLTGAGGHGGSGRGPFVNSYGASAGNRSFSISDVEDDGTSTTV